MACDAAETPYDGVDNDCNARTRDTDLDGDGQNSVDSPFNPGADCDDDDPLVFSGANEVCGDNVDNDCDGQVDERDCADNSPPVVAFLSPTDGETISGAALLDIQVNDDVGAVELVVRANNVEVGRVSLEPIPTRTVQVSLTTVSLPEGSITLRAEATDLKGRLGSALITVKVDNTTPPEITLLNPVADQTYGGYFSMVADVTDDSGVERVELLIDDVLIDVMTEPPFEARIGTSTLAEGSHNLLLKAYDTRQNPSTRVVTFMVDNTPPVVRFTAPGADAVVSGALTVTVTATDASDISSLTSSVATSATSPLTYTLDTARIPNGPYALVAYAVDNAIVDDGTMPGNTSAASINVTVENIDPTPLVTFTTPRMGDGVLGPTAITVAVTSRVGNPISVVHFDVEGRPAGSDATAPYTITHDFSTYTGTVSVVATAVDNAGNAGSAAVVVQVVPGPSFRTTPTVKPAGNVGRSGFDVGDVDGDGVVDVVAGGTNLSVLTGTIAGGRWRPLTPALPVSTTGHLDVRLGDVNGDGLPDIIGLAAGALRVYLNLGGGTFDAGTVYTLPQNGMTAFEVGDLDGDQDPDVVVVGGNTSGVAGYVYLLDNGVYALGQILGGDQGAVDVAIGDVDGDQDRDVVVGRSASLILTVFRNGGIGNFGAGIDTTLATAPETVALGDVTGDGATDIIVAQPGADAVLVLQVSSVNPFALALGPPTSVMKGPAALAVGQITGNATADVVVGSYNGNGMQVLEASAGAATGFLLDETYVVTQNLSHLKLVDFDQDGALDVVASGAQEGVIAYARNLGTGKFMASVTYLAPSILGNNGQPVQLVPRAAAAGNVLGAPGDELVVSFDGSTQNPAELVIYEFNAAPTPAPNLYGLPLPAGLTPPSGLAVGVPHPVSGYDHIAVSAPVAVQATNPTPTAILYELAPPNVTPHPLLIDNPSAVAVGDVDGDGFGEAIFAVDPTGGGGDGAVVINLDATPPVYGPLTGGEGARSVAVGNFDFDLGGVSDFAVANGATDNITVQVWTGAGFLPTTYNAPTNLQAITTGFVGSDGYPDIVGLTSANIFVMEGDPQFGFRTPVTFPAGTSPFKVIGGDFNQDGLFDVLTLNSSSRCSVMLARPQGGFFPPLTLAVGAGPLDFVATDLDLDGRDDLVVVQSGVPSVTILHNNADQL
ncbi:MAG: VCBS repeat-containing protein [Deltaproteobacteria bacterium]|nr:VCBS repeat-containing protein [Deltaproteobacteria bacterium]